MSKKEIKDPERTAPTGAYSPAVEADGWVFVSGQGPLDPKTGAVLNGTIEEQTKLTLSHIERILRNAGCGLQDVVKSTVHLSNIGDFSRFNATYWEVFKNTPPLPARTTVQSVLWGGMKIEIDVIARKP